MPKGDKQKFKADPVKRDSYRYRRWRSAVLFLNPYLCATCGINNSGTWEDNVYDHQVVLEVHHIKPVSDYPELAFDPRNGQILCHDCHIRTHKGTKSGKSL